MTDAAAQPTSTDSYLPVNTSSETVAAEPARAVTLRVVVLSLLIAALLGYLCPVIDYKLSNTFLDGTHLPPGALGVLLVLVGVVNPLLRALSRRLAFSRNELLTVYIACLFSSLLPGHGAENFIIPNLLAPFYFATRENRWLDWLQPYLKPWLTPALNADHTVNSGVVNGWYTGLNRGEAIPWGAWLVPMVVWMSMVFVSYGMMACLSVMLRRQWAENEALAFPLLKLPLQMTEAEEPSDNTGPSFWRNPLMWWGFGIAVFVQMVRGLNLYFPDVPKFPLELYLGEYFSEPPWNQIEAVSLLIYPIAVGIAYLLTSEVSFSLWFFYWFIKLQYLAAYYLGFMPTTLPTSGVTPGRAFVGFQVQGAYWAYIGLVLWTGREHFKHVLRRAFGRARPNPGEGSELMSYPVAFWGFAGCFGILTAFACITGVRLDIALALWASYLIFALALTRVAVEGGLLFLLHDSYPLGAIARLLPRGTITDGGGWLTLEHGLMPASLMQVGFVVHMRGFILPSFVQGFKLAHDRQIPARRLGLLLAAVIVVSAVVSWTTVVRLGYENGGLTLGNKFYTTVGSVRPVTFVKNMTQDPPTGWTFNGFWFAVGALLTVALMTLRAQFAWFPLHPIGYLMCLTYPATMLWFSIFLGWLAKTLIMRFGGPDAYRKGIPLFLGLALGDIAMILFWLAIDGWQGRTGHQLMPG